MPRPQSKAQPVTVKVRAKYSESEIRLVQDKLFNWKKKTGTSAVAVKKADDALQSAIKHENLFDKILKTHFNNIAQDPIRLTKPRFKQFLS